MAAQTSTQARAKINGAQANADASGFGGIPHADTASAPGMAQASMAAAQDTLAMLGVTMPSWKQVAFSFIVAVAGAVAAYVAAPVLASILVAGTLTVTANGFALWLASALGYLITVWASFKLVGGVSRAAGWVARFAGTYAAPVQAA